MTSTTRTGYIYRLWSPNSTEFYIGSSIDVKARKHKHKSDCTNVGGKHYNLPVYQHIRSNGGWDAWRMDAEHTVQFNERHELNRVEGEYIRRLKPSLNVRIECRTHTEYHQDNKQVILEKKKQYYQANKERLTEKAKIYRQGNEQARAEYNKQYRQVNKQAIAEKAKLRYQVNKQARAEKMKQYRQANNEKLSKKHNCLCGGKYRYSGRSAHFKTKNHQAYAEFIELYEYIVQT
jgi:hypothetical protein